MNAYADDEAADLFDPAGDINDSPSVPNQFFSTNAAPLTKQEREHMAQKALNDML